MTSLRSLDVENNKLTSIPASAFSDLANILVLNLYNNDIGDVDHEAFTGIDPSVLILHDNKLTTLPEGVFAPLKNLGFMDLSNNPWKCDCSITWLNSWLDRLPANFVLENSATTTCSSPQGKLGDGLLIYVEQAYNDCLPTTTTLPQTSTTTSVLPSTTTVQSASTTAETGPTGNQDDDSGTSKATIIGIIVASIIIALLIVIVVVIAMYCRHKKYAFWAPQKTDRPDGRKPGADPLKYLARHQVGSFYQDPETGNVSALWETESMRSDYRYAINPETADKDSMKNRYVYENPSLNVNDANDNSVVVVDTNGTTVKELPLSVAALSANGRLGRGSLHSSNESVPTGGASPVPAHGYNPDEVAQPVVPIPDPVKMDDNFEASPEQYQMNNLENPTVPSSGTESSRARSTSSTSDVGTEEAPQPLHTPTLQYAPEPQEVPELEAVDVANSLQTDTPPSEDYEHLNAEPGTRSSTHDYVGLQPSGEQENSGPGLKLNMNAHHTDDYEHLHEPQTPPSPHDYMGLQQLDHESQEAEDAVILAKQDHADPPQFHGGSTDAHGGTAAYTNGAYDASDK